MNPIRVLLVEDNEGDILLTLEALKEGKIPKEVTVVKDGWEALQFIENLEPYNTQQEPELVILDVNLPKVNGHEVLMRIKENPKKNHIPVVMLTTSSSENDIIKSYQNKADHYIAKPLDADDFLRVVDSIEDFWTSLKQHK